MPNNKINYLQGGVIMLCNEYKRYGLKLYCLIGKDKIDDITNLHIRIMASRFMPKKLNVVFESF